MTKERGGSLIFLATGAYGLVFSLNLPMGQWNEPGPGVFPLGISILLSLSGLYWFFQGRRREGEKAASGGGQEFFGKLATAAQIVGLTALFIAVLVPLGYLLTAILYLFILFAWISRYSLSLSVLLAVVFGTGSWLFFGKLLSSPLPQGILPF